MGRAVATAVVLMLLGAGCSAQQVRDTGEQLGESAAVGGFGYVLGGPVGGLIGILVELVGGFLGLLGAEALVGSEGGEGTDGEGSGGLIDLPPLVDSPLVPGLKNLVLLAIVATVLISWVTGTWIFRRRKS